MKYEYQILDYPNTPQLVLIISSLANDGWRVHTIDLANGRALMEREKPEMEARDFLAPGP